MVKLTVMYNLAPEADADEFLRWRLEEHQQNNARRKGVLRTDFYVAERTILGPPKFQFITEAYYQNMEALEKDFLTDEAQQHIATLVAEHKLVDFTAIISTEYAASESDD